MGVWLRRSSHRFHRFAQMVWLHLFSHGIHGFAQMAWLRRSSHGIHGIHRSFVASVLPRNSRNSQKFCCVSPPTEFTEFTEVLLRKSSHGIHGIHRSLGVLLAAWVRQDAIPSYICVNPCYLWETLLCKKLLCVPWVLWEYSLPRISQINTDGWLRKSSHGIHRIHRSLGGCWLRGYGRMPYPPNLCASVPICGRYFSARRFCVFCAFCGRYPCLFCWCSSCSGRRQSRADTTGFCWLRGYGRMPYPPTSVRIRANLWEPLLSQKVLCFPCVLWKPLFCYKSVHLWEPSLSL